MKARRLVIVLLVGTQGVGSLLFCARPAHHALSRGSAPTGSVSHPVSGAPWTANVGLRTAKFM